MNSPNIKYNRLVRMLDEILLLAEQSFDV